MASQHKKERVIAPLLAREFDLTTVVCPEIDTDQFGTFSGEIERSLLPMETLMAKCQHGLIISGLDLCIATEGSFGPHPYIPFCSAHEELLLLVDKKYGINISVRGITTNTNFAGKIVENGDELNDFAAQVLFPSHALILKDKQHGYSFIKKGITSREELWEGFDLCMHQFNSVFVETDMRAMFNQSRMLQIESLTLELIEKMNSICPTCQMPGFSIISMGDGLPCVLCGTPTNSILSHTYACQKCDFSQCVLHPSGKLTEDPMFCPSCNP